MRAPHRRSLVITLVAAFVALGVACAKTTPGEPVTAPVASIEPPAPEASVAPQAAPRDAAVAVEAVDAGGAAEESEEEQAVNDYARTLDAAASTAPPDPCGGRCTGNAVCWIYVHRPPPAPVAVNGDGGWASMSPFDVDLEDAAGVRRQLQCLPDSAHCPSGANGMGSHVVLVNGRTSRWFTCTFYDNP
jgi:hypothetical protein